MKPSLVVIALLSLCPASWAAPIISEFLADNASVEDDQGEFSDWIEIHNPDSTPLSLNGWALTDDPAALQKWTFPSRASVPPEGYLVVRASGRNIVSLFASIFHTNFSLSAGGEYLALINPQGEVVHDFGENYPKQYADISYGMVGATSGYLSKLTMATANSAITNAPPKKVSFSVNGQAFFDSMQVELSHEDPEVEIRYTTDGSEPTKSLFKPATLYSGPITINKTTRLRTRAYKADALPGRVSTEVYIQLGEDLRNFESNLALCVMDSFGTNIDTRGKDELYETAAIFIDTDKDSGTAIPEGNADWSGRIGMRRRGQSSLDFAKKQYHFESWDEMNRDEAVSIFGFPAESDWIIHAPYADKTLMRNYLTYNWSRAMGHYSVRTKYMEVFYNPTNDQPVTRDDYRGVYVFMERIKRDGDRVDIEALLPEHDSEPEITGGYIFRKDKENENNLNIRTRVENQTFQLIEPEFTITDKQETWLTNYLNEFETALHGDQSTNPESGFRNYVNEANAIDNHLLVEITKNIDGYRLSNYIYKDRGGKMNFVAWDYNLSLGNANYLDGWKPEGWYYKLISAADYPWYNEMFKDPEFALSYADRWYTLRRSLFATDTLMSQIDSLTDYLQAAADRNFERWDRLGKYDWPNPDGYQNRLTYQSEVDFMKDWLAKRVSWMDDQFEPPVAFSQAGGPLSPGTQLIIKQSLNLFKPRPGTIYYTLDGTDPRLRGGAPNPSASTYEGNVTLINSGTVKARLLLDAGHWSAINEASFIVGTLASAKNLRITEIMYHPAAPSPAEEEAGFNDKDDFEYLEFLNTSADTIQLVGVRFLDGITFDFSEATITQLAPSQRALIVANRDAFTMRYGQDLPIAGVFTEGKLNNGGETLTLTGADNDNIIAEFAYDDDKDTGWSTEADGGGHSLVLIDEMGTLDLGSSDAWTKSTAINGSPGLPESLSPSEPTDPSFRILSIQHTAGSESIAIRFTSEPGKLYQVQTSNTLTEFHTLEEISGTPNAETTTYEMTFPQDQRARYLRISAP